MRELKHNRAEEEDIEGSCQLRHRSLCDLFLVLVCCHVFVPLSRFE